EHGAVLPRRAGVSSFGFGGVNAHVVLEEYVAAPRPPSVLNGPALIVLSAKTEERLRAQVQSLSRHLERHAEVNLAALAYTLQVGRDALEHRLGMVVNTLAELRARLAEYLANETLPDGMYRGEVKRNKEALAVFSADDELQEALGKWLQRAKYAKLLDLWAK